MSLSKNDKHKEVPSNPERCMVDRDVLSSTGISSGQHSWDVQLGIFWQIGVISKTKDERSCLTTHDIDIIVQISPESECVVKVDKMPRKLRLNFEHDKGKLFFYDLDRKKLISTITRKFTGLYFPFFSGDVKLLPQCPPLV